MATATTSRTTVTRVTGPATTPHNNVAAIYDEFGVNELDTKTLATVAGDLTDEGYRVKRYTHATEGAGSRGSAP